VNRIHGELGGHSGLAHRAMSKQEVASALCRVGIQAGFWSVPEFELVGLEGVSRKIDVVWAKRIPRSEGLLWKPIAAFEIEGHNVAHSRKSICKNADSLTAAGNAGALVLAMVLFQVGPSGDPWYLALKGSKERSKTCAEQSLTECLKEMRSTRHVDVVLDENLVEKLESWVQFVAN
jgi:hypothetical protein